MTGNKPRPEPDQRKEPKEKNGCCMPKKEVYSVEKKPIIPPEKNQSD